MYPTIYTGTSLLHKRPEQLQQRRLTLSLYVSLASRDRNTLCEFVEVVIWYSELTDTLRDGGLGHNNPILHLIQEAEGIFPATEIGCIVSIGTGIQQGLELAAEGTVLTSLLHFPILGQMAAKIDAAIVTAALATSSQHIHRFAELKFRGTGIYYRFDVRQPTNVKLFEYKKMPDMVKATQEYLEEINTTELLQECVSRLKHIAVDPSDDGVRKFSDPVDVMTIREFKVNPSVLGACQTQALEVTWRFPLKDYGPKPRTTRSFRLFSSMLNHRLVGYRSVILLLCSRSTKKINTGDKFYGDNIVFNHVELSMCLLVDGEAN
jgi:hypothetical protein